MKRLVVGLLASLAGVVACGGGRGAGSGTQPDLWDEVQQRQVLRVAMTLQFPPQFYRDPQTREPAGYDVEMLQMLAKDLGVTLEIKDMDFTGQIPALLAGQVDMVVNGLVNTPERAKAVQFSEPYVPYELVLMTQKGTGLTSYEQLDQPGKVIAVLMGSVSDHLARARFSRAEVRGLERQDACMMEVAARRADACLLEQYLAIPFVRNNPQTTELFVPAEPLATKYGCIAVRYGNPRFLYWLDNWIRYQKASGMLDALYDRIIGPSLKL